MRFDRLTGASTLILPTWEEPKPGQCVLDPLVLPEGSDPCPFCGDGPGEPLLDEERSSTGWLARAYSNRWPVTPNAHDHELIVVSPRHGESFATLPEAEATAAWALVLRRALAARARGRFPLVTLSHGRVAGSSQPHAHAQVAALPSPLPLHLGEQAACAGNRCVLCAPAGDRLVGEVAGAQVLVPEAPTRDGEQLVVLDHGPVAADALAGGVRAALAGLIHLVGPVAYSLHVDLFSGHPHAHLRPQSSGHGAYELAGLGVCRRTPEDQAAALRLVWAAAAGGVEREQARRVA